MQEWGDRRITLVIWLREKNSQSFPPSGSVSGDRGWIIYTMLVSALPLARNTTPGHSETSLLWCQHHSWHTQSIPTTGDRPRAGLTLLLLTSEKPPWCSHWERAHSPTSDKQRMTSERVQYSHCREHLPLNELQQLSVIQAGLDYKKPSSAALCQTSTHTSAT